MRRPSARLALAALCIMLAGCGGTAQQTNSSSPQQPTPASPGPPASSVLPPSERTWADVFRDVSSGVMRIDVSTCDGYGSGTGFLIGPRLVATVAHVVQRVGTIRVTSPHDGTSSAARVVGIDHDHDLALLETFTDFNGHKFDFESQEPELGMDIAVLGYPLGRSVRFSPGAVSGVHDHRQVGGSGDDEGFRLSDLVLTQAASNPGNSGGPWIAKDGRVVALTESGPPYDPQNEDRAQGENGGVSAATAAPVFARWKTTPEAVEAGSCPDDTVEKQMERTLDIYFSDINNSDYESAYAQRNPANNSESGRQEFVRGNESSEIESGSGDDYDWGLIDEGSGNGGPHIDAKFVSTQDPDKSQGGERCTLWHLRYSFVLVNGLYLIDRAAPIPGMRGHQDC